MNLFITPRTVRGYWTPGEVLGHSVALAPFFAVHAAHQERRGCYTSWAWTARAAVECVDAAWNMAGEWQARRAVTLSPARFERGVLEEVPRLASTLNRYGISCLRELGGLKQHQYEKVALAIHHAIMALSRLRKTTDVEPVLGSKVLHHYFPSVVPVFDRRYIRFGVMRLDDFGEFVSSDEEGWLLFDSAHDAGGPRLLDYHRYFAFCAAQLDATPPAVMRATREDFAGGFSALAPAALAARRSLLWRLDAKIAEYCLINRAFRAGLV